MEGENKKFESIFENQQQEEQTEEKNSTEGSLGSLSDALKLIDLREIGGENGTTEESIRKHLEHIDEKIMNDLRDIIHSGETTLTTLPQIDTENFTLKREEESFPDLSENAIKVLERRYLKKDMDGNLLESPDGMFWRVARNIAEGDKNFDAGADTEKTAEEFYTIMRRLEFLPNSPTLMNAGRALQQLSACFVLPVEDSMEKIFETIKDTAIIHKSGGGTGFSFSRLRPSNSPVASTNGVSSGPISFMRVFDSATEAIKQGGTRRGANMGILRIDHPDIEEFICCKDEDGQINNFNISVGITGEFMKAYERGESYDLIDPHTKTITASLDAHEVFDKIVHQAWKNGEPGIIFLDRINAANPTPHIGMLESTNPCGEQPLLPYESCNLGSLNLARFVTKEKKIDYPRLGKVVRKATHFLDNVIEMNNYPLEKIDMLTKANRKIGLGVMGFADMLIDMGIPYGSDESVEIAERVMRFIKKEAEKASEALAEKRGTFPNFKGSVFDTENGIRLRNATLTTIAPTGTISIIAGASGGIEPLFAVSFVRNIMDNDKLVDVHSGFERIAKERGFYSKELMEKIAEKGTLHGFSDIPEDVRDIFVTSHEVSPNEHVRIQAAFQKYTDNAVSKTVNFSNSATEEDIKSVYLESYRQGCKGVTIYRDGSRDGQVLSTGKTGSDEKTTEKTETNIPPKEQFITPRPRPKVTSGQTESVKTGCGNLYVTINECGEGKPFELFTQMGKSGGCASSQSEAIGRLVSLAFRCNIEPEKIVKQLSSISCHMPSWDHGVQIHSCADAIAKSIHLYLKKKKAKQELYGGDLLKEGTEKPLPEVTMTNKDFKADFAEDSVYASLTECPDCSSRSLEHVNGCDVCLSCGYSHCS